MSLTDSHGRCVSYLRLSVTDLCNLRCRYCMPAAGVAKLSHNDILSFEDLERIALLSVSLGLTKIRVTGGEPLVRKGIVSLLERLSAIPGLQEIVLTTNGLLLREKAAELRRAGVQRLNVSLDSLNPETYALITRGGELKKALGGIAAAAEAGFPPVKINMVVMRGINDSEVLDFAELTLHRPYTVRFIEYMPTLQEAGWEALAISGHEIMERIAHRHPLEPVNNAGAGGHGPARNFQIPGALGTIGIITPISNGFCASCNRIRVTASGLAKGCLFASEGIDLKPYLLQGDDALREILRQIVSQKPEGHHLSTVQPEDAPFSMAQIGG